MLCVIHLQINCISLYNIACFVDIYHPWMFDAFLLFFVYIFFDILDINLFILSEVFYTETEVLNICTSLLYTCNGLFFLLYLRFVICYSVIIFATKGFTSACEHFTNSRRWKWKRNCYKMFFEDLPSWQFYCKSRN